MKDSLYERLQVSGDKLSDFCLLWKIIELSLFGSVLRDDFRPDSDIDVIVTYASEAEWSLLDHIEMEGELASLFGRDVDLVTRRAVEQNHNWIRRKGILDSAQVVYATR